MSVNLKKSAWEKREKELNKLLMEAGERMLALKVEHTKKCEELDRQLRSSKEEAEDLWTAHWVLINALNEAQHTIVNLGGAVTMGVKK